ncbi:MAG: RNA methyltransferase [Betaproteobacteria bacterium]|nr:MAG: RNA methyltransferase [Betaproteobacteria bacterium]
MSAADTLKSIRIVLCGKVHPGNIGAAARALKTMGLARLHLVAPVRFPDPQAEWLASNASDVLRRAKVCSTLDEALRGVVFSVACTSRTRELAVPMVTAREAAARVIRHARGGPVALVFGNETFGLTGEEAGKCRLLAAIPADSRYPSLNLGAAVQVFCYELRQAALGDRAPRSKHIPPVPHEEVERFLAYLERTMTETGFLDPKNPKRLMPRLRRLFSRAQLEKDEVNILRGLLETLRRPKSRLKSDV